MAEPEKPEGLTLFVSPEGNDTWSGRLPQLHKNQSDGPFASLERARDEIRRMKKAGGLPEGGVTVEVQGGDYAREIAFELTAEDSGVEGKPVTYRASQGQEVRLVGGKEIRGWQPVTVPAVLSRLDESARGQVLQADLKALGITHFGEANGGGLELFFEDKPMTLARWPNQGFVRMVDIVVKDGHQIHGIPGSKTGKFIYDGDRPKRWVGEKDIWLHGYWFWDWSDQRQKAASIDTEKREITLVPPPHGYGYRKGQWYYVFNLLSELDSPGEWYLDRETAILYFWPAVPMALRSPFERASEAPRKPQKGTDTNRKGQTVVSVLPTLVTMKEVSHVTLRGFVFEATRGTAMIITGGERSQVVGCTIRNVGSWAVTISGGKGHGVVGCDIYETGGGGVSLNGGDRKTLNPAGHLAENNHIHHYSRWNRMYQPAIALHGVGNRAAHNLIHSAPHQAIAFSGNDHIMEFNEIHGVCHESNDAGAIYSGRNWTMRGTVIRHNYLHHIQGFEGRGCVGVYLDDMLCGTEIFGNVFYKVTRAAFIGGGRDCSIENNIFVDCAPAVHVDARAMGWAKYHTDEWVKEAQEKGTHLGIRYKEPPYSERYPKLVNIVEDQPHAPRGNVLARNVCSGGRWDEIEGAARPMVGFQDNLLGQDPRFVDAKRVNFQLRDDSPAWKLGFKPIPIEKMGLYEDPLRASWPVAHPVPPVAGSPPPPARHAGALPVFKARRTAAPPKIDGMLQPEEWAGLDIKAAMLIEKGIQGETLPLKSYAWLLWDAENFYVGIQNEVDASKPLKPGAVWGRDDAVEVALRNTTAGKAPPIFVFRGYPNGHFESSTEAGATEAAARKAGEAVKFAARILDAGHWSAEYQIPFAALDIHPKKHTRFEFNVTVRKSAAPLWLMWVGTGGFSWSVENAGILALDL